MTAATPDSAAKHPAADFDVGCFHCGLPLEAAVFPVRIEGVEHGTCCRVCQAVAQTIADNGLGAYYRNRTAAPPSVRGMDLVPDELAVYDLPEVQRGFVRHGADASEVRAAATAERLNGDAQGATTRVATASLQPGDLARVRPGDAIPADGVVVEDYSTADEALLTGESRPVVKRPGEPLTGGAVNLEGVLTMPVTRTGQETVLSGIVRLMDRA